MKKLDPISWIGVAVCVLILAFTFGNIQKKSAEEFEKRKADSIAQKNEDPDKGTGSDAAGTGTGDSAAVATPEVVEETPQTAILKTDRFELNLTNRGGGIDFAKLLNYDRLLGQDGSYVRVNGSREFPIGALSSGPKKVDNSFWNLKNTTEKSVTFSQTTADNLTIEKTFSLPDAGKPYQVEMSLTLRNDSGATINLDDTQSQYIYLGGEEPLHWKEWPMQIGLYYKYSGAKYKAHNVDYFGRKNKILGIFGKSEMDSISFPTAGLFSRAKSESPIQNLSYVGVNNQFFTTLVEAKDPYDAYMWGSKYDAVLEENKEQSLAQNIRGVEMAMGLPIGLQLASGESKTLAYDVFIGPKEAKIIKEANKEWMNVLNYDQIPIFGKLFGWAIKPLAGGLAWGLRNIESVVGNWGIAIILLTILVRLLMWPIYAKSARSMKRMSKLSPMMKELKDKYPDDPQKVQQETMKLYGKYGVNPIGGCLPMFLQLPVFLGFYRMLWGSVELRHENFAFVKDLTMPDEVLMLGSFPLNILPILMSVASFIQMAMTPKTGDNTQRVIFMLMPAIFLVICYNFASGLALYWTVSNIFTIAQTWVMNKLPEPELKESTKAKTKKKGMMAKLQEKIEQAQELAEQQQQQKAGVKPAKKKTPGNSASAKKKNKSQADLQPGQSRTKLPSQKGSRHTKSKKKKRK